METNFKIADASELEKQAVYAQKLSNESVNIGLTVGSAFVESMRNSRYTMESAVDEVIDNALEAGATELHVAFGFEKASSKKPVSIAVIDNGHGMIKEMVYLAVRWGGTHREGARSGFGRFGFGLPSAAVYLGRRYSIYSCVSGNDWHSVTIDLDDIVAGKYNDPDGTGQILIPQPVAAKVPQFVRNYLEKQNKKVETGTIIVFEKLDPTRVPTTASGISNRLVQHLGVVYRNYFNGTQFFVDGEKVQATDPLFVSPEARYHRIDGDPQEATPFEPAEFEVDPKNGGPKVKVRVRYARFPLGFLAIDKSKRAGKGNMNPRAAIKRETTGIIVNRMGRQIDVLQNTPWGEGLERLTQNNDRFWAAEIDFPAELDELFGVSSDKQGTKLSESMWNHLEKNGVAAAIRNFKSAINKEQSANKASERKDGKSRKSERSMEEVQKFKRKKTDANPSERERKAKENLDRFVKQKSEKTERSEEDIRNEWENEASTHPYRVEFEDMPGAPFFRAEQIGGIKVLFINRGHRFYGDLYARESNRQFQAALELLLFVFGECEIDAQGNQDRSLFFASARNEWSQLLNPALDILDRFEDETEVVDDAA